MNKQKIYLFLIIVMFIAIGISSARIIFALWQEPTAFPPTSIVSAPINQSTDSQQISGSLSVGTLSQSNTYGMVVYNTTFPEKGVTDAQGGLQMEQRVSSPVGGDLLDGRIWVRTNVALPSCTGVRPANTSVQDNGNDVMGVTEDTPWTYASPDTVIKCEFECDAGYLWNGTACI